MSNFKFKLLYFMPFFMFTLLLSAFAEETTYTDKDLKKYKWQSNTPIKKTQTDNQQPLSTLIKKIPSNKPEFSAPQKQPETNMNYDYSQNLKNEMSKLDKMMTDYYIQKYSWVLFIVLIYFIAWLYFLVDIARHEFIGHNKIFWIIAITFIPVIGVFLYIFIGADQKIIVHDKDKIERITDY